MTLRLLVIALLAGCLGPATVTCADGSMCPSSQVCGPAGGCVAPEQITACDGLGEGANCSTSSIPEGTGVCQSAVCGATVWNPTVVIGQPTAASALGLNAVGTATDRLGNLYVADRDHNRIWRVDANGLATLFAGTGVLGFSGDGDLASTASLGNPAGVAADGFGNVYVADTTNQRVRRVDSSGVITTIAGTGVDGYDGEGFATEVTLALPSAIAVDGLGNLYIADTDNARIRRVDAAGAITTVAGNGTAGPDMDELSSPQGVAVDDQGNVWIADSDNNRVLQLTDGAISIFAGTGSAGFSGDGGAAVNAQLDSPYGVAVDALDNVYISDRSNNRIRRVDASGTITTVAGNGVAAFGGDNDQAKAATISDPYGVAVDTSGTIYLADFGNNRVRRVDPSGIITTFAGSGLPNPAADGTAATSAALLNLGGVAVDGARNLVIVDADNERIRRVDANGVITTIAGDGAPGFSGDGGAANAAELFGPVGAVFDSAGNLYFSDTGNNRIRRIDTAGNITTVAGTGDPGFGGDGGPATSALLASPARLAIDAAGNLYIADASNNCIRRVDTSGRITTVAGTTTAGSSGDGGPATSAELSSPRGVAVDSDGSVYISDTGNKRIRRVDSSGIITTVAGGGLGPGLGDGGDATNAILDGPQGVAVDRLHHVYIADQNHSLVRMVDPSGMISSVAGNASASGFLGDGGAATAAKLSSPADIAVDDLGQIYIADGANIRRVNASGIITTVAGHVDPGTMGPVGQAQLADPSGIVVTPMWTLFAGGASGTVQALAGDSLAVVAGRYPQGFATGSLARFRDATFGSISDIAYDADQSLIYITGSSVSQIEVITVVDPTDATTWTIAPLTSTVGYANGLVSRAAFRDPTGLYFDHLSRQLYVADTGNQVIRVIDLSSGLSGATVTTIAGTPDHAGFAGDSGPPGNALLDAPQAITQCGNGDLFIADTSNNRVRRISAGTITTVLGDGSVSTAGEGLPASSFPLDRPHHLACDDFGNLFVTSSAVVRMMQADAGGVIDGTGRVRTIYGLAPRDRFPASVTRCLAGLAVVDEATVNVTDSCTGIMVQLHRQPGS